MDRKEEIKETIISINNAIRKHKHLAAWGNVESKERLRVLRASKRSLTKELSEL